ncbi:radical SAM protein [bacterium]|jgi:hypothetical protein|nr:radical SAM protein [bacterium]
MSNYKLEDISWVTIETTNICNMTCDYCPKSLDIFNHRKIGIDILYKDAFIKIIDFLPNLPNLKFVTLTDFNEFFQTPELTTFYLPELKKRGIPYLIASNGSVKPKNIEYYIENPPKYLVLGLQTITEHQFYSNNRLKNTSWNEYLETFSEIVKFFYNNCKSTLISIEIATNPTNNLFHKVTRSVENKNIPSESDQIKNIPYFLSDLSEFTGINFELGDVNEGRFSSQRVVAKTNDERIIFGLKEFVDINNFYSNIPTNYNPTCFTDSITFDAEGNVKMCCIDYKNSTEFAKIESETMSDIFDKYITLVDTMRSEGSPFADCRNCKGFKSKTEKILSIRKNYYPMFVRKFPSLRKIKNFLNN